MLALAAYRASLCPCCGLPKTITQVHERDAPRFVVKRQVCWARKTLAQAQGVVAADEKVSDAHKQSLQWSIQVRR